MFIYIYIVVGVLCNGFYRRQQRWRIELKSVMVENDLASIYKYRRMLAHMDSKPPVKYTLLFSRSTRM